jgi:hypothetical protein
LTGSLAGASTPAAVPAGGGGSVVVTVPAGTGDGAHTIYGVASPSGDTASFGIVVDGTAPSPPVLTQTPTAVSGDTVSFAYTQSEATATVDCTLDGAPFATCSNPMEYAGLTAGSHTFQARATDTVGNVSPSTSYTWSVNLTIPTIGIDFPTSAGRYNDSAFNADCATTSTGDVCGVAEDDTAVTAVAVSLRRLSTGLWWNGTSFAAGAETFVAAAGTSQWTYAIAATALSEGDYTLRAQATDGSNFSYDSRMFTVDRTAPATPTLTSEPPATTGPSATFAFAFTDPDTTTGSECRLDGGAWTVCSSPKTYTGLSHGPHTVNVRAVDGAANTSASTSTVWTVDATAPTAAMTFPTATSYNGPGWAAGCATPSSGDVCGTASDVGSGLAAVAVSIRRTSTNSYWDGGAFAAASQTWLEATGTASWSYLFAATNFASDSDYTVRWRATDAVGNATTGGIDLTFDTAPPPAPQVNQAPSNPSGASVQFNFTNSEPGTTAQCRLDSGAWTTCTAPVTYSGLAAGSHTFTVRANDAAGNISATDLYTWTVNTGLPDISIGFPAPAGSYNNTIYAAGCNTSAGDICGVASDPVGSITRVDVSIRTAATSLYWNGTTFGSATEVFSAASGTTSWSYPMAASSFPTEVDYTLRARATNNAGLTGFDSLTMTIDRTAPTAPTITSGPTGTTGGRDTFAFTGEAGTTFECRLDAGSWGACTSPKNYGQLTDGAHTFDVRTIDRAGNTGAATTRTWTTDATPPTIGTTFPAAAGRYNNAGWTAGCAAGTDDVCGTATDTGGPVSSVEVAVRRDSTGFFWNGTGFTESGPIWLLATGTTSWSLPFAAAAFPAGDTYTLSARATDGTGNVSTPAATPFVIDRTGPSAASLSALNLGTTTRRIETGDKLTLTFSEAIAPSSLIAGWDGTGAQNIVIRQANNTNDALSFYNATNTTRLPLGLVQLKRNDYVSGAVVWGAASTRSTVTLNGTTLTIAFGTPDVPARVATAASTANMSWNPRTGVVAGTGITDLAGNLGTSTAKLEIDLDNDF